MKKIMLSVICTLLVGIGAMYAQDANNKLTAKFANAAVKYRDKPNAKNEENMEQVFQKLLPQNAAQEYRMWRFKGEAYMTCPKEGQKLDKSFEYYTKALSLTPDSDPKTKASCMYNLALMYLWGNPVERDYAKCLELLEKTKPLDNSLAPALLSALYRFGWGVEKDEDKAYEYYLEMVRSGNKEVYNDIYSLQWGLQHQGTPEEEEAYQLYEEALKNIIMNEEYAKIIEPAKKSAELGYAPAQTLLTECYLLGKYGIARDLKLADSYAQQATSQNYVHGILMYAQCILVGEMTKLTHGDRLKKCWELFVKAAEMGHPIAQWQVGWVYSGEVPMNNKLYGAKADKAEAYKWFEKSAKSGYSYGIEKEAEYRKYKK